MTNLKSWNPLSAPDSPLFNQRKQMTQAEFLKISSFIEKKTGIRMPETKKLMMQARLLRRLNLLHLNNFKEYIDFAFSSEENSNGEITAMIDVLTTNLTHFFREKEHFNILLKTVLPSLSATGTTIPHLWSAGCSTGEEAYTLSMVLQEYMKRRPGVFTDYDILATDISTRVLEQAEQAVYPIQTVEDLSYELKHRYFLRNRKDPNKQLVRVNQKTRGKVKFMQLNFMDNKYTISGLKNIIFCRNVLIYFDKTTQEIVISKLVKNLYKGGFLFLGHSETIFGMDLPLENVAPTVFRKTGE